MLTKDKSMETPRQSQGPSRAGRGIPPGLIGAGKRGSIAQSAGTFSRMAWYDGDQRESAVLKRATE